MKRFFVTTLIVVAVLVAALGLAIALGGPGEPPPPMSSISDPFKNVDFSDLPEANARLRLAMALSSPCGPTRLQVARSKAAWCSCMARLPVAAACT